MVRIIHNMEIWVGGTAANYACPFKAITYTDESYRRYALNVKNALSLIVNLPVIPYINKYIASQV